MRAWAMQRGRLGGLVRSVLVVFFLWLAGRHWHPFYGFTQLLQFDKPAGISMLPVLRGAPIYVYQDTGAYDGHFYAQLAASPGLRDPGLTRAIDNLGYRARRILLSWIAWAVALGDPVAALRAYAWLNPVLWFALAALLWRLFPTGDWRTTVAWTGLLFAAGTLHSVRYALTDLATLTLLAGALWQLERSRSRSGLGWLSLAALTRETSVLGAVALLPGPGADRRSWWRAGGLCLLATLPLASWLIYLQVTIGRSGAGQHNFNWPVIGLVDKWCETLVGLELEPDRLLAVSSVLAQVALTVQLVFLVVRRQWSNPWWRLGFCYGVLLLCLGPAVWDGPQCAAMRVLLPLTLAFNVLGVRGRAGALWLILGNLTVLNGILPLWNVPDNPRELTASWTWSHSYLMETDRRWFNVESLSKPLVNSRWAWGQQNGRLTLHSWPHRDRLHLQLDLQGFTPCDLEIRHLGRVVWQGRLARKLSWIQLPELPAENGDLVLELHSDTPPQKEGLQPDARELGFACYGFRLD